MPLPGATLTTTRDGALHNYPATISVKIRHPKGQQAPHARELRLSKGTGHSNSPKTMTFRERFEAMGDSS